MNIMFTLTKKEYEELIGIILKYCCPYSFGYGHCAEIKSDNNGKFKTIYYCFVYTTVEIFVGLW